LYRFSVQNPPMYRFSVQNPLQRANAQIFCTSTGFRACPARPKSCSDFTISAPSSRVLTGMEACGSMLGRCANTRFGTHIWPFFDASRPLLACWDGVCRLCVDRFTVHVRPDVLSCGPLLQASPHCSQWAATSLSTPMLAVAILQKRAAATHNFRTCSCSQ
jgi:hypothetical protein